MTDYPDEDWYAELVESFAPPEFPEKPSATQLEAWQDWLPEFVLKWWVDQGWGSLSKGQYWVCNPDQLRPVVEELFTGDPEYSPDDLIPFGYNALGMIDVFMGEGKTMTINLPFNSVRWRGRSSDDTESDFVKIYGTVALGADRLDWNDENGTQIFPWALKNLGPLAPGEIYGFVPAYSMSQRYPVENLQKLPVVEHLVFLASLQKPTLYDYERPEGGVGGFGTLVPKRLVGPQE